MNLTATDVKRLTEEPSAQVRSQLAAKIAQDYREGNFNESANAIATDIFRILLKDVEKRVRAALSEQLAHCPQAPRDIIVKLANDETEVAVHVLEFSSVLSENDLAAIVQSTREVMKLRAIARRESVPEKLSDCLIDTQNKLVIRDLFRNKGAALPEQSLLRSWDTIKEDSALLETLVHHGGLPLAVAEKLFFVVTDELKTQLSSRYKLSKPYVQKVTSDVREWEMLGIVPPKGDADAHDDEQIENLVDEMHMNGRLTHSLLMRALCVGNLGVFEAGLAKLANVPRVNARILLMDAGGMGFKAIYKAASMPEGFFEAVKILLKIGMEESDYGRTRPADFRRRIMDRIYIGKFHQTVENMEYLLSIIGGRLAAHAN